MTNTTLQTTDNGNNYIQHFKGYPFSISSAKQKLIKTLIICTILILTVTGMYVIKNRSIKSKEKVRKKEGTREHWYEMIDKSLILTIGLITVTY